MGLETYRDSRFHVRFYKKIGFRPSCTGIGFRARLGATHSKGSSAPPGT
jgi:hypothetical protein